jgi:RNA polymerase sigma-70 factor (ECF subfamily)
MLPQEQRNVVYMRYFQNLSFREISEDTGININTALGRMRYAILNMRKMAIENDIKLSNIY